MKKLIMMLLASSLSLCACSNTLEQQVDTSTLESNELNNEDNTQIAGEELGNHFLEIINSDPEGTIDDYIIEFINSTPTPFELSSMVIEEGYLSGFNNTEILGFKVGYQIAPMIGSIPFIAYAFELETSDTKEIEEFKTKLIDSADLRWNICTEADSIICCNKDNIIFFIMSPDTFEE